jgi:hypothetical protein
VQADRGYDHDKCARLVWAKGVEPLIARLELGAHLWVIEQTIALLHLFRRLRVRWESRDDLHGAFMTLAACWRRLTS